MKITTFTFLSVQTRPDEILPGVVYVCDEDYRADLKCPCGCGDTLTINLLPDSKPCWTVSGNTIHPSIQRTTGCLSHFSIVNGVVQ